MTGFSNIGRASGFAGIGSNGQPEGDLTGSYPNPLVVGLWDNPIDPRVPANGDTLVYNGGEWIPTPAPTATTYFQGIWDANTNTPDIENFPGLSDGFVWIVSVAGNTDVGGITDWIVGDYAVYSNGNWYKLSNSSFGWGLTGNTGTNPTVNYVGTADEHDMVVGANASEVFRAYWTGGARISGSLLISNGLQVTNNITGSNAKLMGDLAVCGGDITTNAVVFNLLNGATTRINMGNSAACNWISGSTKFPQGISGSLTRLSNGSSYLVGGNNVLITSQSNGSVVIASRPASTLVYRPGGTTVDNIYSTWSDLMVAFGQIAGQVDIEIDDSVTSPAVIPAGTYEFAGRGILSGIKNGFSFPSSVQLVDGCIIRNPKEIKNIDITCQGAGAPNFDVDNDSIVFVKYGYFNINGSQPAFRLSGGDAAAFWFDEPCVINNNNSSFLDVIDTSYGLVFLTRGVNSTGANPNNLISGASTAEVLLAYDSSFTTDFVSTTPTCPNFLGTFGLLPLDNSKLMGYDDSFVASTLGSSTVQGAIDVLKRRWVSTTANAIYTTSSVALVGSETGIDAAVDKGTDVFFYVSGSTSPAACSVSLFGGKVVVSGSLVARTGLTGSLTKLIDGTSAFVGDVGVLVTSASNGAVTFKVDDSKFAALTGSTFTGAVKFNAGLSGSLTKLADGTSYILGATNTLVTTGSNGSITVSTPAAGLDTYVQFNDGGTLLGGTSGLVFNKSTSNLAIAGDLAVNGGDLTTTSATFNFVNGTATTVNIGGGATSAVNIGNSSGVNIVSGTTKFPQGLSGSLTKLTDGTSYLTAGQNISVVSASNGSVNVSFATTATPTTNDVLLFDGTTWTPSSIVSTLQTSYQTVRAAGAISAGDVCYIVNSGGSNPYPTVSKAQANSLSTIKGVIGLAIANIANNAIGTVQTYGQLPGPVTTNTFAQGAPLYVSTTIAGGVTDVKPSGPNYAFQVGFVTRQGQPNNVTTGIVFVSPTMQTDTQNISDLVFTSQTEHEVATYDSATSTWKNKQTLWVPNTQTAVTLAAGAIITAANFANVVYLPIQTQGGANVTLNVTTPIASLTKTAVDYGRELWLHNLDNNRNITIPAGGNVKLDGGVNLILTPNTIAKFVWTGIGGNGAWVQTSKALVAS